MGCSRPNHSASRMAFIASLRVAVSRRSTKSTPSRWSVSCWIARASSSEPSISTGSPCMSKPCATTCSARSQSKVRSGIDRQPSEPSCLSSESTRRGLTRWPTSPSTFQVKTRRPTPICGAARPAPGASSMVSVRSRDERAELLVEVDDLEGGLAQHRVAEEADRLDGHVSPLRDRVGRERPSLRGGDRAPQPAGGSPTARAHSPGGSTWIRTASSLRAARTRCSSPSAADSAGPAARGHPDDDPALSAGRRGGGGHSTGTGPSTSVPGGALRAASRRRRRRRASR